MSSVHYVPTLLSKNGELAALSGLDFETCQTTTPLIRFTEAPSGKLVHQFENVIGVIDNTWDIRSPIILDVGGLPIEDFQYNCNLALQIAISIGRSATPAIDVDAELYDPQALRETVERLGNGVLLRVKAHYLNRPTVLRDDIQKQLRALNCPARKADLFLDLDNVANTNVPLLAAEVLRLLENLPYVDDWRSIIVSARSFPANLAGFQADSVTTWRRTEWELYKAVLAGALKAGLKPPCFGDHAAGAPNLAKVDAKFMQPSAAIRYTRDVDWLVMKGRGVRKLGWSQYHELCKKLRSQPEFSGPQFSWGDAYINSCADFKTGPGNSQTWVSVRTSHHITFVANQLRTLGV